MKIIFMSLFVLLSTDSFAMDICTFNTSNEAIEALNKKINRANSLLDKIDEHLEKNELVRSSNKLCKAIEKKISIESEYAELKTTLTTCVDSSAYSFAERDAIEAGLDQLEENLKKLVNKLQSLREKSDVQVRTKVLEDFINN